LTVEDQYHIIGVSRGASLTLTGGVDSMFNLEGRVTLPTCGAVVDMSRPIRSERVRDFQPPWRTVYVYRCSGCGAERRVRASSFRGSRPEPSTGAIVCGALLAGPEDK